MINGNGCGYVNNGEYHEIEFLSNLDVDIIGFCPECEESTNGGFAYNLNTIENDILSGIEPNINIDIVGPANNDDLNILYIETTSFNSNIMECLIDPDIDNDGILNSEDDDIDGDGWLNYGQDLSLIHISEPTRPY